MSVNFKNENQINLNKLELKELSSIVPHLAIENVFNSNLINDIAYVDYVENSKGLTRLKPLKGLPDYIDDLYIFKYIHRSEVEEEKNNANKIYLNKGKDASASLIVKKFTSITTEVFGEFCEQKIAFLVNLQNEKEKENSTIYQTLKNIERRTNKKAFSGYTNYYECKNPVGVIKYKINTSRLPLKKVLSNLNKLEKRLNALGAGLMSIDYTRDLSGVLEKKRMVDHFLELGFVEQSNGEEEKYYIVNEFTFFKKCDEKTIKKNDEEEPKIKILNTDATCGRNTFKYIRNTGSVCCVVKYYNKIVSNFEAGDVQKKIGTHLAEYAFTHSCNHLEKTFRHPDVVERGLTRLEISIHGFDPKIDYSKMLEDEFNLVKNAKIFHIQPGAEQWLRLAKHITQCTLFANKATQEISLFWYGSSVTKRVAGVTKKLKNENPKEWEHVKKWMMLNFGFSGVPIYNISLDVVNVMEQREVKKRRTQSEERKSEEKPEEKKERKEIPKQSHPKLHKQSHPKQSHPKQSQPKREQQPENITERRRGRPTKKEEEERQSKLTKEQIKKEEEEKERKRNEKREKKKRELIEMQKETERLKKLTHEERLREEKEKQEKEKQKREKQSQKKMRKREIEIITEEKTKLIIEDFSYYLKKGPTFLTPFNLPSKMYISVNDKKTKQPPCPKDEIFKYPSKILPETENIQWRFRIQPDHHRIGQKKLPNYPFQRFENHDKKISTNSTRERNTLIYLKRENEKSREWIKQTREKFKNEIKKNLKETETIAKYEERKNTIDEVFRCFSNPEEILNVLNENEYIRIFAFKSYSNCMRIAYEVQESKQESKQNNIKVCFANPLLEHMLNGLRDTCFNLLPKEKTNYKPEHPVYFMPYASLKAKGKDGNDLKIVDEIDGQEIKKFNDILDQYYGDWKELQRQKAQKMEEVFEEKIKPIATFNLEPGEYEAYKYLKRIFRGKEQTIIYIYKKENEIPIYGFWLNEELKKIDLNRTLSPIYIYG